MSEKEYNLDVRIQFNVSEQTNDETITYNIKILDKVGVPVTERSVDFYIEIDKKFAENNPEEIPKAIRNCMVQELINNFINPNPDNPEIAIARPEAKPEENKVN